MRHADRVPPMGGVCETPEPSTARSRPGKVFSRECGSAFGINNDGAAARKKWTDEDPLDIREGTKDYERWLAGHPFVRRGSSL
jgi:hypothetical protein